MTQKSNEMLRMERDMDEQPELKEKLEAEMKRIAEAGEAECDGEALVKAAAALGYTISAEELERSTADLEKLDDDELDAAGGHKHHHSQAIFKELSKQKNWCALSYYCYATLWHDETDSNDVACWSNHKCVFVSK